MSLRIFLIFFSISFIMHSIKIKIKNVRSHNLLTLYWEAVLAPSEVMTYIPMSAITTGIL